VTAKRAEPVWLTATQVRMLHAESIRTFGGLFGLRDQALMESALGRPQNKWSLGGIDDLFALAAAYAFGLARNHAFVDGNKRIALLSIRAFLFSNGFRFSPDEAETVAVIERLAAGDIDEAFLTKWIGDNSKPLS